MPKIYKYPLIGAGGSHPKTQVIQLDLPTGSKILSVGVQDKVAVLWALVPTQEEVVKTHNILISGTGVDLPFPAGEARFIGTFQLDWFVGHVFEVGVL